MTREEAMQDACSIVALAYRSIGDYEHASDGFCQVCVNGRESQRKHGIGWTYANQGFALDYVRRAVLAALKLDGFAIHTAFDPETGKELIP